MKITKDWLRKEDCCAGSYHRFLRHFPDGVAEHQEVLKTSAADGRQDEIDWLVDKVSGQAQIGKVGLVGKMRVV